MYTQIILSCMLIMVLVLGHSLCTSIVYILDTTYTQSLVVMVLLLFSGLNWVPSRVQRDSRCKLETNTEAASGSFYIIVDLFFSHRVNVNGKYFSEPTTIAQRSQENVCCKKVRVCGFLVNIKAQTTRGEVPRGILPNYVRRLRTIDGREPAADGKLYNNKYMAASIYIPKCYIASRRAECTVFVLVLKFICISCDAAYNMAVISNCLLLGS